MSEPVWKEFRYQVQDMGGHSPDVEAIQILAQVMSITFADLTPSQRRAIAAWFCGAYGDNGEAK